MNFTEALGYSLKGQNIPKILTIALVFVILGVSVIVAALALESMGFLFIFIPVLLGYALFVSGYTISVIKSVLGGEEAMPAFAFGRDLGRGATIFIASLVYAIPFFVLFACVSTLITGLTAGSASSDSPGAGSILIFCGVMLLGTLAGAVVYYSFIVGQIRYAIEGRAGALFDLGTNFSTVMSNMGTTFGLFIRQFGVGIIFAIVSNVASYSLTFLFSGMMSDLMTLDNPEELVTLGMPFAIMASLAYVILLTIGLMQGFSNAHLIGGYGIDLGLTDAKTKNDDIF